MGGLPSVVLAIIVLLTVTNANPGLQVRLSQAGLNYAAGFAIDVFSNRIRKETIPDVREKKYQLTGMRVTNFVKPSSSVIVERGKGLTWRITKTSLRVQGNWRYKVRVLFVTLRDHGTFDVSVSGVSFRLSHTVGRDAAGRPTVTVTGCKATIDSLRIRLRGGPSWLYNLVLRLFNSRIKRKLAESICKQANKLIKEDIKKELGKLSVTVPIGTNLILDYGLTEPVVFGNRYMDIRQKGLVTWKGDPRRPPYQPKPFPSPPSAPKMVYIWISDYMINSMLYTAYNHGLLHQRLTSADMAKAQGQHLFRTSCPGSFCIGSVVPGLSTEYSNASLSLGLGLSTVPAIKIASNGIQLNVNGFINLLATKQGQETVELLNATVTANASVVPRIERNFIKARISAYSFEIRSLQLTTGSISNGPLLRVINSVATSYMKPQLDALGSKGIELPEIPKAQYVNPNLQLKSNAIVIGANVRVLSVRPSAPAPRLRPTPAPAPRPRPTPAPAPAPAPAPRGRSRRRRRRRRFFRRIRLGRR